MRRRPIRRRFLLVLAFGGALVLAGVFALRLAMGARDMAAGPGTAVEGWMPVGLIARSHHIPRDVLAEAIGIAPGSAVRQSLARIATDRGEPVEAVIARIEAAIAAHRGAGP